MYLTSITGRGVKCHQLVHAKAEHLMMELNVSLQEHWGWNVIVGTCEYRGCDDGIERMSPATLGV
jgi:hypothetical protein